MKDGDQPTRFRAMDALSKMGPTAKEAIPALREALKDPSLSIRDGAKQALEKIRR
jgi:HEAT repeat protein